MFKVKVQGMAGLEQALEADLPRIIERRIVEQAMLESMEQTVEPRARVNAPVEEGELRDSIRTEVSAPLEVATGPSGEREEGGNAAWQEFGTVDLPPKGYMREAADSEGRNALEALREKLARHAGGILSKIASKVGR